MCGAQPLGAIRDSAAAVGLSCCCAPSAQLLVGQLLKSARGLSLGQACAWQFYFQLLPTTLSPQENGLGEGRMLPVLCQAANALPSSSSSCHRLTGPIWHQVLVLKGLNESQVLGV